MTHSSDQSSTPSSARNSVNTLTKYLNMASAGLSALSAPRHIPTKAPPPEIIVRDRGFAIQIDEDITEFQDQSTLKDELAHIPEKRLDLIFAGRTALDLSFIVPNGPFHDLEAMIDTEIAFRSPFERDQCVWFWTAKETAALDWQVEAAIILNTSVDWVLDAFKTHKKTINYARRHTADGDVRIAVYPSWLTPPRRNQGAKSIGQSIRQMPPVLRFPVATFAILLASAIAISVIQSVNKSDVSTQATQANALIAQQAAEATKTRDLKDRRDMSEARLILLGNLAGILPDGVWLEQMTIDDDGLTITGYGPSAAEVTRLLTDLDALTDIQFGSPVTRDNTQNLERFRIDATLTGELG